jgi:hypothetical protein
MRHPVIMAPGRPASGAFVQGFVVSGLLATLQQRAHQPALDQRALRIALQGGAALAAGTVAAQAWQQRNLTRALTAVALGAVGVAAIEHLIKETKESDDGQEKA